MASGTQQHQHQYQSTQQQQQQPHHQQPHQELPIPQQQNNQMQFAPTNQGISACLDSRQTMHHMNNMSPIAAGPMTLDQTQGHMMNINLHHHQQQQTNQIIGSAVGSTMNQDMCNQAANQHHMQQQKNQLLPTLLSPRSTSLKASDQTDQAQQPESDHDQIIDQVISLENDFSDPSSAMTNVDTDMGLIMNNRPTHQQHQAQQQQLQHHSGDTNFVGSGVEMSGANQLSSSSEDLLNLLLEFDRDPTNVISGQQLDQDEKVGIETIRQQLMSCEVQSDHLLHNNSMSPISNQITGGNQPQVRSQQSQIHQIHQGVQQQHQLISQTAPIMSHNQQTQHQLSTPSQSQQRQQSQHHRLSVDQTLLHGSYTSTHLSNTVPVSSSGQTYNPQAMARISQSASMSIENSSPSPSWQQPQLSPYSPQTSGGDPNRPSQRQHPNLQPVHPVQSQQHPAATATSPHIQQLQHPLQRRSPSQSISPPATTEPSPVVKKNPLLNAQLVNSRAPSITPTRFINNQTNVLNQNPILNSKLSQNTFVTNSCGTIGSPVNPSLNPSQPPRYIQQQSSHQQQSGSFSYDITQQQQQNAQQHTPPQTGYMSMYGHSDHQQQTNQIFRASSTTTTTSSGIQPSGSPHMNMSSTSPSGGGLSQQVKQEIRKKVQQPKQQHQQTSLLKQLLSDDK